MGRGRPGRSELGRRLRLLSVPIEGVGVGNKLIGFRRLAEMTGCLQEYEGLPCRACTCEHHILSDLPNILPSWPYDDMGEPRDPLGRTCVR